MPARLRPSTLNRSTTPAGSGELLHHPLTCNAFSINTTRDTLSRAAPGKPGRPGWKRWRARAWQASARRRARRAQPGPRALAQDLSAPPPASAHTGCAPRHVLRLPAVEAGAPACAGHQVRTTNFTSTASGLCNLESASRFRAGSVCTAKCKPQALSTKGWQNSCGVPFLPVRASHYNGMMSRLTQRPRQLLD